MKSKTTVVMLMVMLLVVAMASTAFANTGQQNCNAGAEDPDAYSKNMLQEILENQEPEAAKDEEVKIPEINNQPAALENKEQEVLQHDKPGAVENGKPPAEESGEPDAPEKDTEAPAIGASPQTGQPTAAVQNDTGSAATGQNFSGLSALEREMVEYVNEERAKAGIRPLQVDTDLTKVARIKSRDMVDNGYFAHNSPTYGSPFEMMKNSGIQYRSAGENIAKNGSVINAHQSLMNSEDHRANILNPGFTHIGIGIVNSGGTGGLTVTQMFIAR